MLLFCLSKPLVCFPNLVHIGSCSHFYLSSLLFALSTFHFALSTFHFALSTFHFPLSYNNAPKMWYPRGIFLYKGGVC